VPVDQSRPPHGSVAADRVMEIAETALYCLVALVLVASALVMLGLSVYELTHSTDGVMHAMEETLDSLLLVFILTELLSAVRSTVRERRLVAEPFLLVGIIATIKEIVVVGAFADEKAEVGETMLQIGVLGGVALALSVASLLLRRKEREPSEAMG
jgi:uncharacterized membrane protein (DUF373 family)